jgi:hypothetical protein
LGLIVSFSKCWQAPIFDRKYQIGKNAPTYYCQTINNNNKNGLKKFYTIGTGIFKMLLDIDASLWRHEIQHNHPHQSDTQHKGLTCDTQHNDTQFRVVMLSVVILGVAIFLLLC